MQDRKTTQDPWLASLDTGPSHLDGLSVRQTAAVVARIEARGERDEIARLRRDGFAETLAELRTDEPDLEPGEAEAWARQINADRIADADWPAARLAAASERPAAHTAAPTAGHGRGAVAPPARPHARATRATAAQVK